MEKIKTNYLKLILLFFVIFFVTIGVINEAGKFDILATNDNGDINDDNNNNNDSDDDVIGFDCQNLAGEWEQMEDVDGCSIENHQGYILCQQLGSSQEATHCCCTKDPSVCFDVDSDGENYYCVCSCDCSDGESGYEEGGEGTFDCSCECSCYYSLDDVVDEGDGNDDGDDDGGDVVDDENGDDDGDDDTIVDDDVQFD